MNLQIDSCTLGLIAFVCKLGEQVDGEVLI